MAIPASTSAANHNGFFFVTRQMDASATATEKNEIANPIRPPLPLAIVAVLRAASRFASKSCAFASMSFCSP